MWPWPTGRCSTHLQVSTTAARSLLRQVCYDARFLRSCNIMDYSLLLGIHHVTEQRLLRDMQARGSLTPRAPPQPQPSPSCLTLTLTLTLTLPP